MSVFKISASDVVKRNENSFKKIEAMRYEILQLMRQVKEEENKIIEDSVRDLGKEKGNMAYELSIPEEYEDFDKVILNFLKKTDIKNEKNHLDSDKKIIIEKKENVEKVEKNIKENKVIESEINNSKNVNKFQESERLVLKDIIDKEKVIKENEEIKNEENDLKNVNIGFEDIKDFIKINEQDSEKPYCIFGIPISINYLSEAEEIIKSAKNNILQGDKRNPYSQNRGKNSWKNRLYKESIDFFIEEMKENKIVENILISENIEETVEENVYIKENEINNNSNNFIEDKYLEFENSILNNFDNKENTEEENDSIEIEEEYFENIEDYEINENEHDEDNYLEEINEEDSIIDNFNEDTVLDKNEFYKEYEKLNKINNNVTEIIKQEPMVDPPPVKNKIDTGVKPVEGPTGFAEFLKRHKRQRDGV